MANHKLRPGKRALMHIRCYEEDKARWIESAQIHSLKLTAWVVMTLNLAVRRHKRRIKNGESAY